MTPSSPPRYAGLDGLRALAVILVVVYHLFPRAWWPSGFVGVDVFFVISGFLITSLLLREHAAQGRLALGRFWTRRARRLLPALALVLAATVTGAWLVGGDALVNLGRQLLGAVTFSYNWVALLAGGSYFSASEPEVLRNLWSLAVEEQFYLLWPLLLPLVLLLPRRGRIAAAVVAASASTVWAWMLVTTGPAGSALTRAYYGTDTHAFGLLLGVALAFALSFPFARESAAKTRSRWHLSDVVGGLSLVALCVVAAWPGGAALYPGVPLAASVLTVVVIATTVRPSARLGRVLDAQPLRWIGERSYGIYLWHWPLVVLLSLGITGRFVDAAVPVGIGALALILTITFAAVSYRFVEQPVRIHGFGGVLQRARARLRSTPARRFGVISVAGAAVFVLAATGSALSTAPTSSSSQDVVAAGLAALEAAQREAAVRTPSPVAATPTPTPDAADAPPAPEYCALPGPDIDGPDAGPPPPCVDPDARPRPPAPAQVDGSRISAIGDSVMLASAPGLLAERPGIQIDAAVSRSMWAGPSLARDLAAAGALREYVVVGLGTNGPIDADSLAEIRAIAGPTRTLVLVTAYAPRDWIAGVNAEVAAFAASTPGVVVADWASAIAGRTDLLAGDDIHPGEGGGAIFARTVAEAIDRVENQRAQVEYQLRLLTWATERAAAGR